MSVVHVAFVIQKQLIVPELEAWRVWLAVCKIEKFLPKHARRGRKVFADDNIFKFEFTAQRQKFISYFRVREFGNDRTTFVLSEES